MVNRGASKAYLGLGANLGDPIEQIISAYNELAEIQGIRCRRHSKFYMSSPVGYDDQPNFINCVLEVETQLSAIDLLDAAQEIELRLGRLRVAGNQNAPRVIDIDLLLYDDQQINTNRLTIPHPRMTERLFVLCPLLELIDNPVYSEALINGHFIGQEITVLSIKDGLIA